MKNKGENKMNKEKTIQSSGNKYKGRMKIKEQRYS